VKTGIRPALGTTAFLAVTDASAFAEANALLDAEIDALDRACSRFRDDSELVRLNAADGRRTRVGRLLFEAIELAVDAARATEGLVDPTIGRTLRLAGYDQTFALLRARDGRVRPSFVNDPRWQEVELDVRSRTVRLPKNVELDLGATAKALAADRAAGAIWDRTRVGVLVSLGGDAAVAGDAPPHGWPIRIADDAAAPLDADGPVVAVASGGLATSGTTVRRWTTAEGELHHIVDPRTGRPAREHWRTATVTASSCVGANIASTAAIVLGEAAVPWLTALQLPARLVRYDGAVMCTPGWPAEAA
jgi:thiamine biosynthesis lipoprotein